MANYKRSLEQEFSFLDCASIHALSCSGVNFRYLLVHVKIISTGGSGGRVGNCPGRYLGEPYPEAVTKLDAQDKPAWCMAAGRETTVCESASGNRYRAQAYTKGGHAMILFRESLNLDPPIDDLILGFLEEVLSLSASP